MHLLCFLSVTFSCNLKRAKNKSDPIFCFCFVFFISFESKIDWNVCLLFFQLFIFIRIHFKILYTFKMVYLNVN